MASVSVFGDDQKHESSKLSMDTFDTQNQDEVGDLLTYQEQLERMIATVAEGESHLLNKEEWLIINQFNSLSGKIYVA